MTTVAAVSNRQPSMKMGMAVRNHFCFSFFQHRASFGLGMGFVSGL